MVWLEAFTLRFWSSRERSCSIRTLQMSEFSSGCTCEAELSQTLLGGSPCANAEIHTRNAFTPPPEYAAVKDPLLKFDGRRE